MSYASVAVCTTSARRRRAGRALLLAGTALVAVTGAALADDPEYIESGSSRVTNEARTLESKTYIIQNGGSLDLGGPYTAGNAVFDVLDGSLAFWSNFYGSPDAGTSTITLGPSSFLQFRDSASGAAAAVTMAGAALLDLSLHDGPTFVLGSLAGGGGVVDLRDVTLELGNNDASTGFAGVIGKAGEVVTGGLTKVGTGTLTLAGDNLYTGATTVEAGGLVINGDNSASDVLVEADGWLAGTGSIGDLDLFGMVAAGPVTAALAGTLTVTGDVIFRTGSSYLADFTPTSHDLLDVAGSVTVEGGTIKVAALDPHLNYTSAQTHQIIAAGALAGADNFTLDLGSPLLLGTLIATGDTLSVRLMQTKGFEEAASSSNGKEAGRGVNDLPDTPDVLAVKNQLLAMDSAQINDTYKAMVNTPDATQKMGEAAAVKQATAKGDIAGGKLATLLGGGEASKSKAAWESSDALKSAAQKSAYFSFFDDPAHAGVVAIETAEQVPVTAQIWSIWLAPIGAHGTADTGPGTVTWWSGGLQGGIETTIGQGEAELTAGLLAGYQRTGIWSAAPDSFMDQGGGTLGVYGTWQEGGTMLSASLAETVQMVNSRRYLSIGALDYTPAASYLQYVTSLSAEASHTLEVADGLLLTPLGGLDASYSYHGLYTETGAGPIGMRVDPLAEWRLDAGVGLVAAKSFRSETGTVTASASAKYQRVLLDGAKTQTMQFVGGTAKMEIERPSSDLDRAVVGVGLGYTDDGGLSTSLSYTGSFTANSRAHGISASLGSAF